MATTGNRFVGGNKKLTAKDFAAVDKRLGFALPSELRAHYARNNGGKPVRRYFRTRDGYEQSVQTFLPMCHRSYEDELLLEAEYVSLVRKKKLIRSSLIPFAIDEGCNFYCIDTVDGSVKYCPMDVGRPVPERHVAGCLDELIDGMVDEDEFYG